MHQNKRWSKTIYVAGVIPGQLGLLFIILIVPVAKHTAGSSEKNAITSVVHILCMKSQPSPREAANTQNNPVENQETSFSSTSSIAIISTPLTEQGYKEPQWCWQDKVHCNRKTWWWQCFNFPGFSPNRISNILSFIFDFSCTHTDTANCDPLHTAPLPGQKAKVVWQQHLQST